MHKLLLASQSPRRKEILEKAGFQFSVDAIQISEIPNENLNLSAQIEDLALRKAQALVANRKDLKGQGFLILSSDTVVVLGDEILGKPQDISQAKVYIGRLSGSDHLVITGVCLWDLDQDRVVLAHEKSVVTFHRLSQEQIDAYCATGDGMDKAGAYGIQSAGRHLVKNFTGEIENIMGLPIQLVQKLLSENGWIIDQRKP